MTGKPNYLPDGYQNVIPFITCDDPRELIKFVQEVFSAQLQGEPMENPDGDIGHVEFTIGDSHLMAGKACEEYGKWPAALYVYVKDTDAVYNKAIKYGCSSIMEPADQFYGDRNAGVKDSNGNMWWIATHVEDVAPQDMKKRAEAHHAKAAAK